MGLGSVAFHGTLYKIGQAFDEVPMLYCVLTFTFIGICQRYNISSKWRTILATVLVLHSAVLTILVTVSEGLWQFVLFHLSFNSAHAYALYHAWKLYQVRRAKAPYRTLYPSSKGLRSEVPEPGKIAFERGALFYASAITCWLTDMLLCEYVNPHYSSSVLPINPQLHAWWHLFISCGLYYMALQVLIERMETIKGQGSTRLEYVFGIIPYVVLVRKEEIKSSPRVTRSHSRPF